jgi:hypothetical protein
MISVRIAAIGSRSELILSVVSVLVSFGPVRRSPPTAEARLRAGAMKAPTPSEHLCPDLESVRSGAGWYEGDRWSAELGRERSQLPPSARRSLDRTEHDLQVKHA